jgi:hypothetical protein
VSPARELAGKMLRFLTRYPNRWCQYQPARTKRGVVCAPSSPHAYSYCLVGLQEKFRTPDSVAISFNTLFTRKIGGFSVAGWNDCEGRMVTEVQAALRKMVGGR